MSSYAIKAQIEFRGNKVPVLKPDHVSLGKCVTSHQFVKKYASINDLDIISLLRNGCIFKGFKRVRTESAEEEGFANMHFVLLLSSLDGLVNKQLCIRRISKLKLGVDFMATDCEVLTSSSSAVVMVFDRKNQKLFLYHFKKYTMKSIEMPLDHHDTWKFVLISDVLYVEKGLLFFVNFVVNKPFIRKIHMEEKQVAIVYSNEMVVLVEDDPACIQPVMMCDMLRLDNFHTLIVPEEDVMETLFDSILNIIHVKDKFVWLAFNSVYISVFTSQLLNDLSPCFSLKLTDLFPNCTNFSYKSSCYCNSTNQIFTVYSKLYDEDISSAVIVLDLSTLTVSSILELELTMNRRPQIDMHTSMSGHKLFVQETFESKVIFYQVFKLLPTDLSLQNITKQFVWENLSEKILEADYIPKHLKAELNEGF